MVNMRTFPNSNNTHFIVRGHGCVSIPIRLDIDLPLTRHGLKVRSGLPPWYPLCPSSSSRKDNVPIVTCGVTIHPLRNAEAHSYAMYSPYFSEVNLTSRKTDGLWGDDPTGTIRGNSTGPQDRVGSVPLPQGAGGRRR